MQTVRKADHSSVPPLINEHCRTLILGSMLSPKSVDAAFYYAHPQNRFWRILAAIFDCEYPTTTEKRATLALSHGIALWDVISKCDIVGAADSTIKNVEFNDINGLLTRYPSITRIFTTGGTAYKLLVKYGKTVDNAIISSAVPLPSTSPLNCSMSLETLIKHYSAIAE